jgi:hypothetical protein
MTTERDKLMSTLFESGTTLVNIRCFRGASDSVTSEQICAQLKSAFEQKAAGVAVISPKFNDQAHKIDVRAWISALPR